MADEEKRFLFGNECSEDSDCLGQCCRGLFRKMCGDYTKEGSRCYHTINPLVCGCEPGTSCKFVHNGGLLGLPAYLCVSDAGEGSGDM
ncbi:Hypothetical predicted protein [Paramuricea clavata]|nr:Hypothetical predicted protein [Paramuricea clavata]